MHWDNKSTRTTIIALVVTLGILFGGYFVRQNYFMAKQLTNATAKVPGVSMSKWQENNKINTVKTDIALQNDADLPTVYNAVLQIGREYYPHKAVQISIQDTRSDLLKQFYHEVHFYIYEAIQTGSYVLLQDEINNIATKKGIVVFVQVDTDRIYLKAKDNKGSVLYEVVRRLQEEVK